MTVSNVAGTTGTTTGTSATATSASEQSDRFLKLLVTQMQNQDPLNPLDNAQVTSQMAQISTVTGIETLNNSIGGLNSQFISSQAMQAAALVGHDVAIEGDRLRIRDGVGDAGFELSSNAEKVKVEITTETGTVLDTIEMTGVEAGRHAFTWNVPEAYRESALSFKVTATTGTTDVEAMSLAHERITAVSNFGDTLALELANGDRIANDAVWAFL